jgi:hypothetical protein
MVARFETRHEIMAGFFMPPPFDRIKSGGDGEYSLRKEEVVKAW